MTTSKGSKYAKAHRPTAVPGGRGPSTVKGQASRRLNQKVWATVKGKTKNVRFYRLVETVFYVLKADVRLLDGPPQGSAEPPCSEQGEGPVSTH